MITNLLAALRRLAIRSTGSLGEPGQASRAARLSTGKWTLELLKHLEWRRLEELCAAYFQELGFKAAVVHERADGAAEICLYAADAGEASILVHTRSWDAYPIGMKPLRELRAAMSAAKVAEGVMLAAGRFTAEAAGFAAKERIDLIDGASLLARLDALPAEKSLALLKLITKGDFLTPTCPRCFIKMTASRSTGHGRMFWGCRNYPSCKLTFSSATITPA